MWWPKKQLAFCLLCLNWVTTLPPFSFSLIFPVHDIDWDDSAVDQTTCHRHTFSWDVELKKIVPVSKWRRSDWPCLPPAAGATWWWRPVAWPFRHPPPHPAERPESPRNQIWNWNVTKIERAYRKAGFFWPFLPKLKGTRTQIFQNSSKIVWKLNFLDNPS